VTVQDILAEMEAMRPRAREIAEALGAEGSRVRKLSEAKRVNDSAEYNAGALDLAFAMTLEEDVKRAKEAIDGFAS
jgi:hypothetical protein